MSLTARSWCTGYGGLEMAVRAAFGDFEVLSVSDIKPAAASLLAYRHPDIPNLGDMRAVDHTALEPADLMIGSWPCGPHSAAGKRLGEADPRELWPEYLRAIDALRPALFFGENVARITSNGELRRVVTSLAERGYVGAWVVRSAADVGACHLRKRCFVVAVDLAANPFGEAWRLARHTQPGDSTGTDGLGAPEPGRRDLQSLTLLPTPRATDGPKGGPGMRGSSGDLMLPSAVMQLLPTPEASDASGGRVAAEYGGTRPSGAKRAITLATAVHHRWGAYADAITRHEHVLGRPAPEPTQASQKYLTMRARRLAGKDLRPAGMRGSLAQKRQLSARFVEWMMMLPEGWVADVPGLVDSPRKSERNAQLSLLGDGVVPAQGAAAFRFLLDHLAQRLASERAA